MRESTNGNSISVQRDKIIQLWISLPNAQNNLMLYFLPDEDTLYRKDVHVTAQHGPAPPSSFCFVDLDISSIINDSSRKFS